MNITSRTIISLAVAVLLGACAGGITKTTVGNTTTYKQDGKEISKEQVAAGNSVFADEIKKKDKKDKFQKELRKAPRRTASEPVSIALLKPIVEPGPKIDKVKLDEYWRTPFENQKKLPLVSQKKVENSLKSKRSAARHRDWLDSALASDVPGDVYIQLIIKSDAVLAKNKKTKEVKMVSALIYRAEIASPYLEDKVVVEETVLNIFQNVEQLNKLGDKVREVVKKQIRPQLPSTKWLRQQQIAGLQAQL